jgi:RNA polymerase sigma-70 factor (ECF subfamily)
MWARSLMDTADLVQESLINTIPYLDRFEPRGKGALRAYLCRAVDNRIKDEMRKVGRRGVAAELEDVHPDQSPSPFDETVAREAEERYRAALRRLSPGDQQLIVGRVELGYSFEQLALISGKRRADSARVALHRAMARLAREMADVQG